MLSKIHLKPESLSNFTIYCRSLLRDFLLASLEGAKVFDIQVSKKTYPHYPSIKQDDTYKPPTQEMVNRPNQCTNNTTLLSSSEVGCSFFLMGRWGWRFCPALIHNLPQSFLQLTSYTATNKKSHESECSYRFVSSQVKINSLVSRNPRKLGKKNVCW